MAAAGAFSVDGVFHPLTVTDRETADLPAFGVALAHVWPSRYADERVVEKFDHFNVVEKEGTAGEIAAGTSLGEG